MFKNEKQQLQQQQQQLRKRCVFGIGTASHLTVTRHVTILGIQNIYPREVKLAENRRKAELAGREVSHLEPFRPRDNSEDSVGFKPCPCLGVYY